MKLQNWVSLGLCTVWAFALAGCGTDDGHRKDDDDAGLGADVETGDVPTASADATQTVDPGNATFSVRGSIHQIQVTHATPGQVLEARDAADLTQAVGTVDHLGSLVLRKLPAGPGYRVYTVAVSPPQHSRAIDVLDGPGSLPPPTFYSEQKIQAGTGYITTRDGTTLAYFATLPGPPELGPYPTIVNYSGYDPGRPGHAMVSGDQASLCDVMPVLCNAPSDASALIAAVGGYATVSVNIRGTGCSGGAYDYFEELQLLDGYDVIETVAAQSWVAHHKVGMVGLSYPGITQLFVAKTQPPSLAAIAPLSVIGNTATTLVPGGILNSGFALNWISNVYDRAAPYGQGWEQGQVDKGDLVCKENQLLHDQRINNVEQAKDPAYYTKDVMNPLNPTAWADQIHVPVFLACGWQDEQTGPFFTTLLDRLTNAPSRRFTVYNGVHADGFAPPVLAEWKAFLDIYVAQQVPYFAPELSLLAPQLTKQVYGPAMNLPPTRWTGVASPAEAKAKWEAEPSVRILVGNGATDPVGAPHPQFELSATAWPPPQTKLERWYFQPDGSLADLAPAASDTASHFLLDPDAGQRGNGAKDLWSDHATYTWKAPDDAHVVAFTSPPLTSDRVFVGTGSVDLWLRALDKDVSDADLEVNLTEVRPDGQEMYVQSGWLRASFRSLDKASTDLWPAPSMDYADRQTMVPGTWTPMRIAIAGFGHVFRAGSRIRLAIDTPGDSRADWRFDLIKFTHAVGYDIAHNAAYPSSVALPLLTGAVVPPDAALPACPSLRGQPCRPFVPTTNTPAAP